MYHRILTSRPELLDIAIRFTVQVNLFSGSIINFGNNYHRNILENRPVGCFALTEKYAGVYSGLIINTTFEYLKDDDYFLINTEKNNDQNNVKNWISQGLTAGYCVLFTTGNYKKGKKYFKNVILPFLIKLRENNSNINSTYQGIKIVEMDKKSTAEYLDNVEISFNNSGLVPGK